MREQLASFKQQLAGQKIINDRLMRKATAEKASKIKGQKRLMIAIDIIGILLLVRIYFLGFPLYFILYALFMSLFSLAITLSYHKKVDKVDFMNGNLKNVVTELKILRNKYQQWYRIGVPLVIVFIVIFYYTLLHLNLSPEFVRSVMIGGGIGIVIGGFIGVSMNNKVIHLCDDIIRDIESN